MKIFFDYFYSAVEIVLLVGILYIAIELIFFPKRMKNRKDIYLRYIGILIVVMLAAIVMQTISIGNLVGLLELCQKGYNSLHPKP